MKKDKRILIARDEFEEEASEGLGRLSRDEAEADLRELKARMERRVTRPRAIWLPAAAAVALLLVASAVVVSLLRERPAGRPELAELQKQDGVHEQKGDAIRDTAYIAMAGPIEKEGYPAEDSRSGEKAATARHIASLVPEAVADYELAEAADKGHEYQVADQVSELQAKEEPVVTMVVAEGEKAEEVVVQAVPQMTEYAGKAQAVNEIRDEKKVATGDEASKKAKQQAAKDDTAKEAARALAVNAPAEPEAAAGQPLISAGVVPVGGWDAFMKWTSRNIRYPEGIEPVVRQVVTVSFRVQSDSTLSDLKAVSSPGEPFTREAFRLLLAGPKWVPAGGGETVGGKAGGSEVVLRIVFR